MLVKDIFLPFVKNYGLYTVDDIKETFDVYGFKQLSHEHLAHGPLSQHHFVLQYN
jgi:hypothetical protein